ncbi:MAG: ABC transporter substrate-binding protein, partial [Atopobiaceae bacterium]|nr:ABC transporter substrate-binding protein [Atopobiaceae bacterium]
MSNNVSRRNFVKLIGAAGAVSASTALFGCNDSNQPTPSEGSEAGSAAAGAFKFGHIGPVTGGAAAYGTATQFGAQIACDEINAAGEMAIEYQSQDDEHDPEKSVNAYNMLKDWGMQVLSGRTTTGPSVAGSTETNADRIFELTPSASSVN